MAFCNRLKKLLCACSGGENWRKHFWTFFKKTSCLSRIGCILGICEVFYKHVLSGVVGQQLACAPACCSLMGERVGGLKVRRLRDKNRWNERRVRKGERSYWADFCPASPCVVATPPRPPSPSFYFRACHTAWQVLLVSLDEMPRLSPPSSLPAPSSLLGRPSRRERKEALTVTVLFSSSQTWVFPAASVIGTKHTPNGPLGRRWAPPSQSLWYIWCTKPVPAPCVPLPLPRAAGPFLGLQQPRCDRE